MAATAAEAMPGGVDGAKLLLVCDGRGASPECAEAVEMPFAIAGSIDLLGQALGEVGWMFALATSPEVQPRVFAPMCRACAKTEMPEVVEAYDAVQARKAH